MSSANSGDLGYCADTYQATNAGVTVDGRILIVLRKVNGKWLMAAHETVVRDASCTSPVPQYEGSLLINNRRQVIGTSNLAGDQTFHPFLWDKGKMRDLGTLGGANGVAIWLTDNGEVIGQADVPGSQAYHGFRWKDGAITDLGTLEGDQCSRALMGNSKGQIVGGTLAICQVETTRAFLWENGGPIVDLNSLILGNTGADLYEADNINERGEIVASGLPAGCNDRFSCGHVYLLIPCDANHADIEGCVYRTVE